MAAKPRAEPGSVPESAPRFHSGFGHVGDAIHWFHRGVRHDRDLIDGFDFRDA